ncbi:MAG: AI-2E family transporter [Gammaproteobacteria bacterium]|nr:AI-2E family transporter [Gammaproteobacteria bacterium]
MNDIPNQEMHRYLTVAWILMAVSLIFVLWRQLLIALFAGLLVHEVVLMLEPKLLKVIKLKGDIARVSLVTFVASIVIALLVFLGLGIFKFFQAGSDNLPALLNKMAEVLESSRNSLPLSVREYLPANVEELRTDFAGWLREHAAEVRGLSKEAGRAVVLTLIGMVIGAMIALRKAVHKDTLTPFQSALAQRIAKLASSFRNVVFAQIRIAAINAFFTGIYLIVILPLFGIDLPFIKTMIALTFLFGLLPVVGNLASNTIIVVVSLSHSLYVAISSLAFLIVIHKAEYFLNARIIGSMIRAKAWEILITMIALEAVFGISGVVAAPIYYAYLKSELSEAKLISN